MWAQRDGERDRYVSNGQFRRRRGSVTLDTAANYFFNRLEWLRTMQWSVDSASGAWRLNADLADLFAGGPRALSTAWLGGQVGQTMALVSRGWRFSDLFGKPQDARAVDEVESAFIDVEGIVENHAAQDFFRSGNVSGRAP